MRNYLPLATAIALATSASLGWAAGSPARGTSFVDNFDRLDSARWFISGGWANGDFQNCTWSRKNVSVSNGTLGLTFEKRKTRERDYACAEIQTRARFSYGTYEARMKSVAGAGFDSAFFSFIGDADKQPHDEIDFEVLGKNTAKVQLNQYVAGKGGHEKLVAVPGGADSDFHDYAFVWEPDRIRYYVDGKLVHTVTDKSAIPTHPQKIFASLWASETFKSWLGAFEPPARPLTMQVKRIAFTALGHPCQFKGSVACGLAPASQ